MQVDGLIDVRRLLIMQARVRKTRQQLRKSVSVQGITGHILPGILCDTSKELTILVRIEVADPVTETGKFLALDTKIGSSKLRPEYGAYPV